jgi:hypothetical protein
LRKGSKGRSGRNAPIVNQLRNDDFSNFELLRGGTPYIPTAKAGGFTA